MEWGSEIPEDDNYIHPICCENPNDQVVNGMCIAGIYDSRTNFGESNGALVDTGYDGNDKKAVPYSHPTITDNRAGLTATLQTHGQHLLANLNSILTRVLEDAAPYAAARNYFLAKQELASTMITGTETLQVMVTAKVMALKRWQAYNAAVMMKVGITSPSRIMMKDKTTVNRWHGNVYIHRKAYMMQG